MSKDQVQEDKELLERQTPFHVELSGVAETGVQQMLDYQLTKKELIYNEY